VSFEPVRVVVVEDNSAIRKNLLKALSSFNEVSVVGEAADGESAVEVVVSTQPDVVLLDLELPAIDGIEVTRRLKRKGVQAQVLILTSFDDEAKVYEAMQAGASGYLVKRVGPAKVREALQEVNAGGVVIEALIARRFWNYFHALKLQAAAPTNQWALTELEFEVLRYVAKGLSNAEVGQVMAIERRTVKTHLTHIYRKMGVNSHVDAVVAALKAGVVQL
jgi:DNA-binding NarL/FixJ family response regulator